MTLRNSKGHARLLPGYTASKHEACQGSTSLAFARSPPTCTLALRGIGTIFGPSAASQTSQVRPIRHRDERELSRDEEVRRFLPRSPPSTLVALASRLAHVNRTSCYNLL